jgi:hypothetical protein
MTINGINVVCGCDNATYNLFTKVIAISYETIPWSERNILRVYN